MLFFFGCSEVNSTWLITSELANQLARKILFTYYGRSHNAPDYGDCCAATIDLACRILGKKGNLEAQNGTIAGHFETNSKESTWIKRDARVMKLINKSLAGNRKDLARLGHLLIKMNGVMVAES